MSAGKTVSVRNEGIPLRTLRIEVLEGPDAGLVHTATSDTVSIGTASDNDVVLHDETTSRYHVELARRGDRIHLRDLGSTNGTEVGTVSLENATLAPGTRLTLGRTALRVDEGSMVTVDVYDDDHLCGLFGRAPEMRRLMASIQRAAQTDVSVLVLGETGTGKEVIAHAIHEASARSTKPMETVDCGALLPTLIASELFGHEKGAFTGADRQYAGAFERADGGTIFLDEIGELPSSLQPSLLGVLERRKFRRLGGDKQISVDVRIIGATNRDLRSEVNAGAFRQDLYYRIAVLLMRVAPLRERTSDIPILVEHFLRQAGFKGGVEQIISPNVMQVLKEHRWPGNVRELRNFVETALAIGEAPSLESVIAAPQDDETTQPGDPQHKPGSFVVPPGLSYDQSVDHLQRQLIERAMKQADGAVGRAAELLRIDRSRLSKLRRRLHTK